MVFQTPASMHTCLCVPFGSLEPHRNQKFLFCRGQTNQERSHAPCIRLLSLSLSHLFSFAIYFAFHSRGEQGVDTFWSDKRILFSQQHRIWVRVCLLLQENTQANSKDTPSFCSLGSLQSCLNLYRSSRRFIPPDSVPDPHSTQSDSFFFKSIISLFQFFFFLMTSHYDLKSIHEEH